MKKNFLLVFLATLFSACTPYGLKVETQYISRESLASYYVQTPDPLLDYPLTGQRLIITWSLDKNECFEDLLLKLRVRFHNHEEDELQIQLKEPFGVYIYTILNEKFCQTGGILTYQVEIIKNGIVLEYWKHPLWVELIKFDIPKIEDEKESLNLLSH